MLPKLSLLQARLLPLLRHRGQALLARLIALWSRLRLLAGLPALALLLPLLSTACAGSAPPPPIVSLRQTHVPSELLTCSAAPAVPAVGVDDATLWRWIVADHVAGQDCRNQLARVAEYLRQVTVQP